MSPAIQQPTWVCTGITTSGASHVGRNIPRQDSISCWPEGLGPSTILTNTLSDGNGSDIHPESAIGAPLATQIGVKHHTNWTKKFSKINFSENMFMAVAAKVSRQICEEWTTRVTQHADCEPLPRRKLAVLTDEQRQLLLKSPQVAYGATLLSASVSGTHASLLKLGDGVIACITDSGDVSLPFNEQEKTSQRTASFCSKNAADKMEYRLLNFTHVPPPSCIVLASDGYPDAVGGIKPFIDRVRTFWRLLQEDGISKFAATIKSHFEDNGDNLYDDATLGFVVRSDWLPDDRKLNQ